MLYYMVYTTKERGLYNLQDQSLSKNREKITVPHAKHCCVQASKSCRALPLSDLKVCLSTRSTEEYI